MDTHKILQTMKKPNSKKNIIRRNEIPMLTGINGPNYIPFPLNTHRLCTPKKRYHNRKVHSRSNETDVIVNKIQKNCNKTIHTN